MGCVECVHPQKPCPGLDAETGGDGEPRGTSPRVFLLPSTGAPKPVGSPSCPHPPRPARRRERRPVWRRRGPRVPAAPCALCHRPRPVTRRAARGWPAGRAPSAPPSKAVQVRKLPPGPPGQLGASRLRVSGSLPSPKGQWGPTALPSCPEGRRRLGRGGLGLSWPAWAQGAGPGPLRGTWQANGAGMRCSPRPGPRHSGIWGYSCPHHILKRRERRGVWGAPSWQVLAPVPARPLSCPEQNPLWVRAPHPATQRERT